MLNPETSLTTRQRQILDYIRKCVHTLGYPPSVREICSEVGLSSTSTVHGYLTDLEKLGFIRRDQKNCPPSPGRHGPCRCSHYGRRMCGRRLSLCCRVHR